MVILDLVLKGGFLMEQNNTPLYTAMKKYIEDKAMAFHTPGHKQGKGAANELH